MSRDQRRGARRDGPSSFRCGNCRLDVSDRVPGTAHRNHCPNCLWSRHLDELHLNRTAADDSPLILLRLAVRPLAQPPFPIEHIGRL